LVARTLQEPPFPEYLNPMKTLIGSQA